ncbi:hypothetical protein RJ639_043823 [Escallonia herrerae]|uniref:C2 domain-containing protein n=1 Tax=Escallonia herrerae TaxID=1293975 RepID=A0AA88WBC7_9ASTE|nr:hypothetical protein RJ639_043823 [Escallonia herrerae]
MTSINGGSSSGRKPRVLEIAVRNAALSNTHECASTYVKIRIDKHKEAETKEVSCINGSKPEWNQGFVFTVKRSFVFDKDSVVRFEVFRTRKFLPDKTVGVALCKMDDFFKLGSAKKEDINDLEVAVKYDDSDQESDEEIQPEKEQQKEAIPTLMGSASLRVDKGKYIVGWLSVDMVVWKGHPLLIGDCNWQTLAMDYEEFMGNNCEALMKKKKKRLMCFGSSPTKI